MDVTSAVSDTGSLGKILKKIFLVLSTCKMGTSSIVIITFGKLLVLDQSANLAIRRLGFLIHVMNSIYSVSLNKYR